MQSASADWSKALQLDTIVIPGQSSPATCNAVYGNVQVCNAGYGSTGWLGIAQVWTASDGHIAQGTVKLNDTYFGQSYYNTPSWRRLVSCQEIGHTLGLDHQDVNTGNLNLGSCMDYTNDPSGTKGTNGTLSNEHPNKHDYDELSIIYNHLDASQLPSTKLSVTAAAQGAVPPREQAAALKRQVGLDKSAWGRAIAFDAKGRARVYVNNLGNGVELTTFVTWAGDAPPGSE